MTPNRDEIEKRGTASSLTAEEREACVAVLQRIADDPSLIQHDERMKALIAKIHHRGKKGEQRELRQERTSADRTLRAQTAMVRRDLDRLPLAPSSLDTESSDVLASPGVLQRGSRCYICKRPYSRLHVFYHLLCPECAEINYAKRQQRADLTGRIALLTGGRLKIGFQIAVRLLRDGARVILTTRFPTDAHRRFIAEPDYARWGVRLDIHGLDLRCLPHVEAFTQRLKNTEPHLDILINNAAQTVKRPLAFYSHLLEREEIGNGLPFLLEAQTATNSHSLALLTGENAALLPYFPPGSLDPDGQQEDHRPRNSWSLHLGEIGSLEALEVHLVNAVAPFILCDRLRPLLARSPFTRRFIVNVSAMEGQFERASKTSRHPHTNMAKAALNMLTRTAAADCARDGIYMNSVDTGWVTDENPQPRKVHMQTDLGFFTPLDVIDGAARVYDPIARGISEPDTEPLWGQFLKDNAPYPW